MNRKKDDYKRYKVLEYLVLSLEDQELYWFDLTRDVALRPNDDMTYRIQTFPGLWIDGPAILADNYQKAMKTLEAGLASPEHAAFVREMKKRGKVDGK